MKVERRTVPELKIGNTTQEEVQAQLSALGLAGYKSVRLANTHATRVLYVGHDASVSASTGWPIDPGQSLTIPVNYLNKVWVFVGP